MASTASGYGTYAPSAIDPFQIESVLAKIVGENNPAAASNMLDLYQIANTTSQSNYNAQLEGQHEFAKQQLAQQLYEAKLKEAPNLLNAPGGAHLMGVGGIPGMDLGTDPTVMQGVINAADAAQQSKQFEAGGKGYEGYSNAGVTIPINALPGLPPGTPATQTENVRLAQERLRSQTALATAAMRGNQESKTTVSGQSAPNAYGEVTTTSRRVPSSQVEAEQAAIEARNQAIRDRRAGNAPAGPGVGGGSGSSLPPASTSTRGGSTSSRTGTQLDTNSPNGKMAQGGATIMTDRDSQSGDPVKQKKAADIRAGMRDGTVFDTHMAPDGKSWVRGKSGSYYPINN